MHRARSAVVLLLLATEVMVARGQERVDTIFAPITVGTLSTTVESGATDPGTTVRVPAQVVVSRGGPNGPSIDVTLQLRERVRADSVTVYVVIDATAANPGDAAARVLRSQRDVVDTLARLGLKGDQVLATPYGVGSTLADGYGSQPTPATAFTGRTLLRIAFLSLDRLPLVSSAALSKGATMVMPPQFALRAADSARNVALDRAMRDARHQAEVMAKALGGRIGALLQASTDQYLPAQDPISYIPVNAHYQANQLWPPDVYVAVSVLTSWQFLDR